MINLVVAAGLLTLAGGFPQGHVDELHSQKCGYESCPVPKPGMLNVHLVPHTHDDVGWLKTVDQYYFGSRTDIQNAGVQYIIDSVVSALVNDPKKKFIYVETAFFWKWWNEQEDHMRHKVKRLVQNGQLEFIGGAWSMNDEATTHYQSIIDQFTWGFRRLNDTFGTCGRPKIGWQIDPFGHSKETASLMAHFGFDGLFFGRLDYQDKSNRLETNTMEMIWEGNSVLGVSGDILTGVLYNHYSAPPGFCFDILCRDEPFITDINSADYNVERKDNQENGAFTSCQLILNFLLSGSKADIFTGALFNLYQAPSGFCFDIMCGDEPIIDDIDSPDYNVPRRVNRFLQHIEWQKLGYRNDQILMTMGGDFNYQDAHYYFKNLEKLIRYVNQRQEEGSQINVFYSTPSCYVKSLNEANTTWPTKQDDFFPYSSDPHAFWTGYFTSRPTLKYFERQGNNYLQICKQLGSFAVPGVEHNLDINFMREAMGVMQHHDAITGTEKQHVADDYARILTKGMNKCSNVINIGLNKLMSKETTSSPLEFNSCHLMNISECSMSSDYEEVVVTVYNPLSRPVDFYVRLPVSHNNFEVTGPTGEKIQHQIVPIPDSLVDIPGRTSSSKLELVFKAESIPPLGYRSYYVQLLPDIKSSIEPEIVNESSEIVLGDDIMKITFNGSTGLLSSISLNGKSTSITQSLEYYEGAIGNNHGFENRSSGAYIFRPKEQNTIKISTKPNITIHRGPIVTEIHQVFSSWASQVIRQYAGEVYAECEWLVGPIPIQDGKGKEIISRYSTKLETGGLFYTDSNGRQTLERKRNYRATWNLDLKEPVAGNYYPITTDISINDKETELTIVIDRAEGGSSLKDGEVELMLHRRLLHDDAFGVDEALNEVAYGQGLVARGRHWILAGSLKNSNWQNSKRLLVQEKVLSPQVVLTLPKMTFISWSKNYRMEYSGLSEALPPAVQILTLEPWRRNTYLLRLEHIFESGGSVDVDLTKLFSVFDIVSARETSLGADRWLDEVSRFKWRKETNDLFDEEISTPVGSAFPVVTLTPKQIRTFICEIKPKNAS
ncbi:hypothetical protein RUM44_004039 [Polyplax serrata]|uniref:Alpha-mannosidase n=1 Tax=Polyplax serrata TaxID=468196 RepID=A0ABR1B2E1_POLSC